MLGPLLLSVVLALIVSRLIQLFVARTKRRAATGSLALPRVSDATRRLAARAVRSARIAILPPLGHELAFSHLADALKRQGFEVRIWVLDTPGAKGREDASLGHPVDRDAKVRDALAAGDEERIAAALANALAMHSGTLASRICALCDAFQPDVLVHSLLYTALAKDLHDALGITLMPCTFYPLIPSKHLPPLAELPTAPAREYESGGMELNEFRSAAAPHARQTASLQGRRRAPTDIRYTLAAARSRYVATLNNLFQGALSPTHQLERKAVALPPITAEAYATLAVDPRSPTLCAWSPCALPRCPDWAGSIHTTGFMDRPTGATLSAEALPPSARQEAEQSNACSDDLEEFLRRGDPPVLFAWGSDGRFFPGSAKDMATYAAEVALNARVRAVVLGDWESIGLTDLPDGDVRAYAEGRMFFLNSHMAPPPLEAMVPRCVAAVTHGDVMVLSVCMRHAAPIILTCVNRSCRTCAPLEAPCLDPCPLRRCPVESRAAGRCYVRISSGPST